MACVEYCPNCLHNVVCAIPVIDNLLGELSKNREDSCSCFMPEKTCKPIKIKYKNWLGMPLVGDFCECGYRFDDLTNYCPNCGVKIVD